MLKIIKNAAVLIITTILCIFFLEYMVRIMLPQYDPSGHVSFTISSDGTPISKEKGLLRQIKNTGDYNVSLQISPLGLRESKPLKTSTLNDYFVVGDSFSFGWGVDENNRFSNILDQLISGIRVFNISIPTDFSGYGKLVSYAKKNGAKINKLIIGVTMENDIKDYSLAYISNSDTKRKTLPNSVMYLNQFKYFLKDNSASYFLITSFIHKTSILKNLAKRLGLIVDNYRVLKINGFNNKRIRESAKKLHSIGQNQRTLVLIIPSRGLWVGDKDSKKIADKNHRLFISEIRKFNIDYVDMRQTMESSGNPMKFHFKYDGHWNEEAHNLAAKELANKINSIIKISEEVK